MFHDRKIDAKKKHGGIKFARSDITCTYFFILRIMLTKEYFFYLYPHNPKPNWFSVEVNESHRYVIVTLTKRGEWKTHRSKHPLQYSSISYLWKRCLEFHIKLMQISLTLNKIIINRISWNQNWLKKIKHISTYLYSTVYLSVSIKTW